MLIKCPNCSVRYEIPEEIGLVEGRKLKCSACDHVFVYTSAVCIAQPNEDVPTVNTSVTDEPLLSSPEETVATEIFLPESEPTVSQSDALTETFTPVDYPEVSQNNTKYRLSWFSWLLCIVILCVLAGAGFYYSDLLSSDYLLAVNRHHQAEIDMVRHDIATMQRNKVKKVPDAPVAPVSEPEIVVTANTSDVVQDTENTEVVETTPEVESDVENTDVENQNPEVSVVEPVNDDSVEVSEETSSPEVVSDRVLEAEPEVAQIPEPVVVYKDKEIIRESDGKVNVKMKGCVQNPSEHELVLPPVVHAIAFDANGQELFTKDIYLTDRYLDAGQTQDFFGSYIWHPQSQDAQIQWIEMSF